ncbi:probable N-acetylglucosaminyl-phosphatidylinositol de-N-acetylase isoform X2 [Arachis ipaensis]|uniref:probable N-acetylglucosaminyl-phosphatidylinositol de-N-acetylase isoform X2 n=1 Tax=Arachis ipaensis TaxID=130454 RepID=UPI000A2B532A|nr:probable N-acetylglucosaminyl-phosphatidylinositol de-N-acetylase isoform X2 [Arachis ipaensis]
MAWLVMIASLILVTWIVSLFTILILSFFPFTNLRAAPLRKRNNVLLVIAHPDDESMFFTPTINFLTSRRHNVQVLCLSIGDADGKGNIRKKELFQACVALKIITFDNYGVSGHCNHRDVHYGVSKLLYDTLQKDIDVWELVSTNILRKYSGPIDIWLTMIWAMLHSSGTIQYLVNEHPRRSYCAMAQHASQWVWFRKLFVTLSSYTYVNTLRKIQH